MSITAWRTSLRLARRTARRSLGRTILIAALIGLPVMGASWVAVMQASTAPSGETLARQQIGTADATALVTTMPAITVDPYMAGSTTVSYPEPPSGQITRDPAAVDLGALLPPGSRIVPALDNWSSTLTIRTPDAQGNYFVQHLNPYGSDAVLLAVDLATNPPRTAAELDNRCRANGVVVELHTRPADLTTVRTALDEWIGVVDAQDEDTRVRRINEMLGKYADHPRLSNHAGDGWHVHYRHDSVSTGRLVATLITTGTALHLAGRGVNRLGRCATGGCDNVYADLSRTGRQRYCSPACANRDAVRRHRTRART